VYHRSISSSLNQRKTEVLNQSRPRKDSAVHVSLSSSSLVKQPGTRRTLSPEGVPHPHPTANNNRFLSAVDLLIIMRSIKGAKDCLGRWANAAPRSVAGL